MRGLLTTAVLVSAGDEDFRLATPVLLLLVHNGALLLRLHVLNLFVRSLIRCGDAWQEQISESSIRLCRQYDLIIDNCEDLLMVGACSRG